MIVVDPSPIVRVGLAHMLHGLSAHRVVGCCGTQGEALRLVREHAPDVVLTEVMLVEGTGLGLLCELRDEANSARVTFFSSFDEDLFGLPIARSGGSGYVNKNDSGQRVVDAITQVHRGELAFSGQVCQQLLELRRGSSLRTRVALPGGLSPREFEVFRLMGKGLTTEEIAEQLKISPKTVGLHRFKLNNKLGCRSLAELYRSAVLWSEGVLVRDGADVLSRIFLLSDASDGLPETPPHGTAVVDLA